MSMELSQQEDRSGLPFPTPGDLLNPGIEPDSLASPALVGGSLLLSHLIFPGKDGSTESLPRVRGRSYPLWSKQWCRPLSSRPCGGQKPGSGRRLLTVAAPPTHALFARSRSGYCLGGTLPLGQSHYSSSLGLPWRGCWGPCGGSGCPDLKGNTNTYVPKAAGMMTWTWWRGQQCFKVAALQGPERKSWIVLRFYR